MSALWAASASWRRSGPAVWLMDTDRARALGSWSAWTSTSCVPWSVRRTCTLPYSFFTTGPSKVRSAVVVVVVAGAVVVVSGAVTVVVSPVTVVVVTPGSVPVPPVNAVTAGTMVVVASVGTLASPNPGVLLWKLASRARAPLVAAMAGTARRIGLIGTRIGRSGYGRVGPGARRSVGGRP